MNSSASSGGFTTGPRGAHRGASVILARVPAVRMRGYEVGKRSVSFRYEVDGAAVRETYETLPGKSGLVLRVRDRGRRAAGVVGDGPGCRSRVSFVGGRLEETGCSKLAPGESEGPGSRDGGKTGPGTDWILDHERRNCGRGARCPSRGWRAGHLIFQPRSETSGTNSHWNPERRTAARRHASVRG